jgi:hypothetical protein
MDHLGRTTAVPVTQADVDFLTHPDVKAVIGRRGSVPGEPPNAIDRLEAARRDIAAGNPTSSRLTLDDIDNMRDQLRQEQGRLTSTLNTSDKNRQQAAIVGKRADRITALGDAAAPGYKDALDQYGVDTRSMLAFQHGLDGKSVAEATKASPGVLETPEGQQGYSHGQALKSAQDALSTIAPGSVKPQVDPSAAGIAHAGAAMVSGSPLTVAAHIKNMMGIHLPDDVQQTIAKQLFDPKMTAQAVANLRKGGADLAHIRQLGTTVGGAAGANIARLLSGTTPAGN